MKKLFKYTLPVIALCALASCSDDTTGGSSAIVDPNTGKELISFSGEGNAITRASLTRAGFHATAETEILMKIVAEDTRTPAATSRNTITNAIASISKTDTEHSVAGLLGAGFAHSDVRYKDDASTRYWDDAFGRNSKLSVFAVAVPGKTGEIAINTSGGKLLAYDGSVVDSNINPNWYQNATNTDSVEWTLPQDQSGTGSDKKMDVLDLTYSNNIQSSGKGGRYTHTYASSTWSTSMGDGQLLWISQNSSDATETTGKFDQGHLIFKHALSYITINLTEGDGFDNTKNTDFIWTGGTDQNITLYGFTLHGTLDVTSGTWSSASNDIKNITKMKETSASPPAIITVKSVECYCLPGRDLSAATGNVIKFQIDNNDYYVTGTQIVNAIRSYYTTGAGKNDNAKKAKYSNFTTMKEGEHYVINLKVGKKKIDNMTAQVLDWEQVNSDVIQPSNVHTSFTLEDRSSVSGTDVLGDGEGNKFSIFRTVKTVDKIIDATYLASNPDYTWQTGYNTGDTRDVNNSVTASKTWSSDHWTTTWYWPDNKTFYHFRAVGDYAGNALASNFVTTATNDYYNVTSGTLSGSSYKDYIWGAPFVETSSNLTYDPSTNGFDGTSPHQISKGISATDSQIKMLLFHMTSQIYIKVKTTNDGSADKVELYKSSPETKTQVNLLRIKKNGTVLMGNGLVAASSSETPSTGAMGWVSNENIGTTGVDAVNFSYGIVPQDLSRGDNTTDKVGLQIITPDGNEYIIDDLSQYSGTVTANNLDNPYTETGANTGKYYITSWRPGYKYSYTITLKKTGIQNITAAVLDWETVTGDLGTINLEN